MNVGCVRVSVWGMHVNDASECVMCESECMNDVSDVSEYVMCESECVSDVSDVRECE